METEQFECACRSASHVLRFHYDPEEHELYLHVRVDPPGRWSRFWARLRQLMGLKPQAAGQECFILDVNDAGRLRTLLDRLLAEMPGVLSGTPGRTGIRPHVR